MLELFVTADDRTGAFECGGIIAGEDYPVPTGPTATGEDTIVIDMNTRQVSAQQAYDCMREVQQTKARFRTHKMDAGLRGNWPHEVRALVDLGYKVAIVPGFPDAGRRCRDGVVYIHGKPVLESPFGKDPLTAPVSSRPDEVLKHAGCEHPDIVIWDADTNEQLEAAAIRCREEGWIMVGPAGAIGAYADAVLPERIKPSLQIEPPVTIICGSLNATSREQLANLGERHDVTVIASDEPQGAITAAEAQACAADLAESAHEQLKSAATLIVIGGDTVGAVIGDETVDVLGTIHAGIPIARYRDRLIVTKGGGIGEPDVLIQLLENVT